MQTSKNNHLNQSSNLELTNKLKVLKGQETKILGEILLHIVEVDRRKLFLSLGYSSLFDYLVREIGYPPASAMRRIDAARLMRQVPELGEKIESGVVSLSQVSKVQKAIRDIKKSKGEEVTVEVKKELLLKLENQTPQKTETLIAQSLHIEPVKSETKKYQKDESVRLELTLTKSQMEMIEEAKALLSNSLPGATLAEVISHLAEKLVKSKTQFRGEVKKQSEIEVEMEQVHKQEIFEVIKFGISCSQTKPLNRRTRKFIYQRDQCCQYENPKTGVKCGAKNFLQIDHISARLFGGTNSPENLRLLCSAHHKMRHQGL